MKVTTRTTLLFIAGILVFLLGILGLFLPFLQGILFIVIGIVMMNELMEIPAIERLKQNFKKKKDQLKKRWRK